MKAFPHTEPLPCRSRTPTPPVTSALLAAIPQGTIEPISLAQDSISEASSVVDTTTSHITSLTINTVSSAEATQEEASVNVTEQAHPNTTNVTENIVAEKEEVERAVTPPLASLAPAAPLASSAPIQESSAATAIEVVKPVEVSVPMEVIEPTAEPIFGPTVEPTVESPIEYTAEASKVEKPMENQPSIGMSMSPIDENLHLLGILFGPKRYSEALELQKHSEEDIFEDILELVDENEEGFVDLPPMKYLIPEDHDFLYTVLNLRYEVGRHSPIEFSEGLVSYCKCDYNPALKLSLEIDQEQIISSHNIADYEEFQCPMCLKPMNDPTTLDCGHSACITCIQRHLPIKAICKVCREKIPRSRDLRVNVSLKKCIDRLFPRSSYKSKRMAWSHFDLQAHFEAHLGINWEQDGTWMYLDSAKVDNFSALNNLLCIRIRQQPQIPEWYNSQLGAEHGETLFAVFTNDNHSEDWIWHKCMVLAKVSSSQPGSSLLGLCPPGLAEHHSRWKLLQDAFDNHKSHDGEIVSGTSSASSNSALDVQKLISKEMLRKFLRKVGIISESHECVELLREATLSLTQDILQRCMVIAERMKSKVISTDMLQLTVSSLSSFSSLCPIYGYGGSKSIRCFLSHSIQYILHLMDASFTLHPLALSCLHDILVREIIIRFYELGKQAHVDDENTFLPFEYIIRFGSFKRSVNLYRKALYINHQEAYSSVVTWEDMETAVKMLFLGDLQSHAMHGAQQAMQEFHAKSTGVIEPSVDCVDLKFSCKSIAWVLAMFESSTRALLSEEAAIYLTAIVEYICTEILELSKAMAMKEQSKVITADMMMQAIKQDVELAQLIPGIARYNHSYVSETELKTLKQTILDKLECPTALNGLQSWKEVQLEHQMLQQDVFIDPRTGNILRRVTTDQEQIELIPFHAMELLVQLPKAHRKSFALNLLSEESKAKLQAWQTFPVLNTLLRLQEVEYEATSCLPCLDTQIFYRLAMHLIQQLNVNSSSNQFIFTKEGLEYLQDVVEMKILNKLQEIKVSRLHIEERYVLMPYDLTNAF